MHFTELLVSVEMGVSWVWLKCHGPLEMVDSSVMVLLQHQMCSGARYQMRIG